MLSRYLLPADVYIRHWLVARELGIKRGPTPLRRSRSFKLLDVGGSLGELGKFLPCFGPEKLGIQLMTVDIKGGDVVYGGDQLPFRGNSFEAVVSIDTLEHIPAGKRLAFVDELVRVARKKTVLAAPFASPAHEKYEEELIKKFRQEKREIPGYLIEHRDYGLVTEDFLAQLNEKYKRLRVKWVGGVGVDKINFAVHTFEVGFGKLNRLVYFIKLGFNLVMNLLSPLLVDSVSKRVASRVLIVIEE